MAAPTKLARVAGATMKYCPLFRQNEVISNQYFNGRWNLRYQMLHNNSEKNSTAKTTRSWQKLAGLATVGAVLGFGTGYALVSSRRVKSHGIQAPTTHNKERPKYEPSRSIKSETDTTGLKLTLYQYQTCPFCCKTRALLDYYGLSYDVIEVNSVWRTQIKWSKYKKVPILMVEGQGPDGALQMNDSSMIVSALESYLLDRSQSMEDVVGYFPILESKNEKGKDVFEYPNRYFIMYGERKADNTTDEIKEIRKWRKWADSNLVHMLSPNVYRTPREALQAFNYFSDVGDWKTHFGTLERHCVIYVGATAMYFLGKVLRKRHKLKEDVRESLYDSCKAWTKAVGGNQFKGGDKPDLSDLTVYGVLSSIEGCEAFQDLLNNTDIHDWYYRTKKATQEHMGAHPLRAK